MVDMTLIHVTMPYAEIDRIIDDAHKEGMSVSEYIRWACRTVRRLRFVPVIGTCK